MEVNEKKGSTLLKRYRDRMLKENKNIVILIAGETGSGKSYSALRMAEVLDPSFNISRVCFNSREFFQVINSGELEAGNIILYDEAGIGLGSRDFMTKVNKSTSYFLQAFRRMNVGLIMTMPFIDMVDKQGRQLAHVRMVTRYIDRTEGKVYLRVDHADHNYGTGKQYWKFSRIKRDGKVFVVNQLAVKMPSVKLRHAYEKRKKEFVQQLGEEFLADIEFKKKATEREQPTMSNEEIIQQIMDNKEQFIKTYNRRTFVDSDRLIITFNLSYSKAKVIKKIVEDKMVQIQTEKDTAI